MTINNNDKWDNSISYYNYKLKPKLDPKIEKINSLILHAQLAEATFPYLADSIYSHNNQSDICDLVLDNNEDTKFEIEMFYTYHENIAKQIELDDQILEQILYPIAVQNKENFKKIYTNLLKYQNFDEFYNDLKSKIKILLKINPQSVQDVDEFILKNIKPNDNQFTYFLAAEFVHENTTNSIKIDTLLDTYGHNEATTFPCGHTFNNDEDLDECPFCNNNDED